MSEQYLLEMKGIHKSFPGVKALQNVGLQLKAGEVHALLGENGAGKSTLIKVLGGIYHAEEGEIYIDGQKAAIDGVVAAREAGISIVHQELVLVPYMTVAENIFLGREPGSKMNINRKQMTEEAQKLMDTYEMNINADTLVEHLTIAQQQMVEIVKAISFNSKILVMDEPTSSISDKEVGFLFETMRALTKKGVGIIYISHKMSELEEICDRVTVMRDGETVGTKVVKETTKDELIAMMVGRELTNYYTRDYLEPGEVVLKCEHISDNKMAKDATFELRRGEIIGFAAAIRNRCRRMPLHAFRFILNTFTKNVNRNFTARHIFLIRRLMCPPALCTAPPVFLPAKPKGFHSHFRSLFRSPSSFASSRAAYFTNRGLTIFL